MSIPLEAVLDRSGRSPLRLTPVIGQGPKFSTAAVGGFSSATFDLPGDPARWKRELPHLSMCRLIYDAQVIWEGQIEDVTLNLLDGQSAATVSCFGLQRLLQQTSVRRIWSKRDLGLTEFQAAIGAAMPFSALGNILKGDLSVSTGSFDPSDLTKSGVRIAGNGTSLAANAGALALAMIPTGATVNRIMGTATKTGTLIGAARIMGWTQGSSGAPTFTDQTSTADFNVTLGTPRDGIGFGAFNNSGGATTPTSADHWDFTNLRVLGSSVTEDTSGGIYGGTILRDLIGLVPGLSIGIIDDGSDFAIPAIERSVRSTALDVVTEVAGYYTREWRVWTDGQFDWRAVNRDEPQWVLTLADLADGSQLTTTVDGTANTLYVLYTDPAYGFNAEASASATSQRNPFVKQGKTSDVLLNASAAMTSTSASQLANKLIGDVGNYPAVQGRLILPATRVIRRASGSPLPALMIRGGDNVVVADLPKSELFSQGRDGETLFHVVSTETDIGSGMTTLEIEGQTNRADIILARLAAATRVLTG